MLKADAALMANPNAKAGIEDMSLLFTYLEAYKVLDKVGCIALLRCACIHAVRYRSRSTCLWHED